MASPRELRCPYWIFLDFVIYGFVVFLRRWEEVERESGVQLVYKVGGVQFAKKSEMGATIDAYAEAMDANQIPWDTAIHTYMYLQRFGFSCHHVFSLGPYHHSEAWRCLSATCQGWTPQTTVSSWMKKVEKISSFEKKLQAVYNSKVGSHGTNCMVKRLGKPADFIHWQRFYLCNQFRILYHLLYNNWRDLEKNTHILIRSNILYRGYIQWMAEIIAFS